MTISIGSVTLSGIGESQIDWVDRYTWTSVGQTRQYALSGDLDLLENYRGGRTITLTATLPWAWLLATTVANLQTLANTPGLVTTLTWGTESHRVAFRRDQGPLDLTPVTALKQQYTGSIYLIEV
jgi:hypothetical protein